MAEEDLYAVLGLQRGAGSHRIREAYRRLAKALHPDLNPGNPGAGERFKEVVRAYWVLSDQQRRETYLKATLHCRFDADSPEKNTSDIRTEPKVYRTKSEPESGRDVLIRMPLTLEEIGSGVMKKVKIRRQCCCAQCQGSGIAGDVADQSCPVCKGTGQVPNLMDLSARGPQRWISCRKCAGTGMKALITCQSCAGRGLQIKETFVTIGIPPGSNDRDKIVVKGQGHDGILGGKPGDLKVILQQKPHPYLERNGADLIYRCPVTFLQWLEGDELLVPSLQGPISLNLERGSRPTGTLKVRGRGLPRSNGERGDLLVQYRLCVPEQVSRRQKQLLKRLESTPGFSPKSDSRGWYPRAEKTDKSKL